MKTHFYKPGALRGWFGLYLSACGLSFGSSKYLRATRVRVTCKKCLRRKS